MNINLLEYKRLLENKSQMEIENADSNEEIWDNIDDYFLFEGISKYGMEEWDRIMRDSSLWDHSETKIYDDKDVWKLIFKRIEEKDPSNDQEEESIQ